MKKLYRLTSVMLAALMAASAGITGASAHTIDSELKFNAVDNAKTIVTYADGHQKTFDGVIDVKRIEDNPAVNGVAAYELVLDGDSVLSVELNNIEVTDGVGAESGSLNGYYAVTFDVEENKEAFLTGLTGENVESVQSSIVESYVNGKDFMIESVDFIDTEKHGDEDVDSELCWAAAASNVLAYTGWGEKAGFKDCDELFDLFTDSFTDGGGYNVSGYAWFFNGVLGVEEEYLEDASLPKASGSGRYLPDYAYDQILTEYDFTEDRIDAAARVIEDLRNGNGISLGGSFFEDNTPVGGHAVTLWGYVVNNDYGKAEPEYYESFIFSDSDSDMTGDADRRTAPNCLRITHLTPYSFDVDIFGLFAIKIESWICSEYHDLVLTDAASVVPYSDALAKETALSATKKKSNTVDFVPDGLYVSSMDGVFETEALLYDDAEIFIAPIFENLSNKAYSGNLRYSLVITDEKGERVYNQTHTLACDIDKFQIFSDSELINIGKLPVGSYTAEINVNPSKTVREAYFYNNTYSQGFEVVKPSIDKARLSLTADFAGFDDDGSVLYELNVAGLSDDEFDSIVNADVFISYYYEDFDEWDLWDYADGYYDDMDAIMPSEVVAENNSTFKFMIKLTFEDGNYVYLQSDEAEANYPSVYVSIDDEATMDFSNVEENAMGFADGEKIEFTLVNTSFTDSGTISGTYHLEAIGFYDDEVIVLTDPVEFSVAYDDETEKFEISEFDYALPKGEYILRVVLDGDFAVEGGFAGYIIVGEADDDVYYPGDVNCDGKLNIDDATLLQKYLAELAYLDELQLELADVDGVGGPTVNDVTYIQKMIAEVVID